MTVVPLVLANGHTLVHVVVPITHCIIQKSSMEVASVGSKNTTVVFRYEDFQEELLAIAAAAEPAQLQVADDAKEVEKFKRDERLRLKQRLENNNRMSLRRPLSYWWRQ